MEDYQPLLNKSQKNPTAFRSFFYQQTYYEAEENHYENPLDMIWSRTTNSYHKPCLFKNGYYKCDVHIKNYLFLSIVSSISEPFKYTKLISYFLYFIFFFKTRVLKQFPIYWSFI